VVTELGSSNQATLTDLSEVVEIDRLDDADHVVKLLVQSLVR
jgi:hypothetical protein